MIRRFVLRVWNSLRAEPSSAEAAREIDAHVQVVADELTRRGMPAADALRRARLAIGGAAQTRERHRDARMFAWIDDARRDVRYGLRSLARTPSFTAIAVLTLGLGIGANTAIFSVVNAVLLDPLPFPDGDRLVEVVENIPASETPNGRPRRPSGLDLQEFLELKAHSRTLSHLTARGMALVSVAGGVDVQEREVTSVSASAFPMLGVRPLLGRWFKDDEEQPGHDREVILSSAAWQRYFSRDPQVLGKTLTFNGSMFSVGVSLGSEYTVVGVMPADFHFPDDSTQLWIPYTPKPSASGAGPRVGITARLATGASLESAAAELAAVANGIRQSKGARGAIAPDRFEFVRVQDIVGRPVKPLLLTLTGAVGLVLLIACANVANLLLARTAARDREIAIRRAIGAGRGRLVRQLLTESLLLAILGGALGTLLAVGGVRLFQSLASEMGRLDLGSFGNSFPRLDAVGINLTVLAFAILLSVGTGLVFGLLPALRQPRVVPMEVLRGATGTSRGRGGRPSTQGILVIAEIAMATVLLIGGGLLITSFLKLMHVDSGYDPANVLTFQLGLPGVPRPPAEMTAFAEDLTARLRSIPSVEVAAYTSQLPLVALENSMQFDTKPFSPRLPGQPPKGADIRLVSRDFLRVMGVRVLAGRGFGDSDRTGSPRVVLINRTLAQRDFPDRSPVGTMVYVGRITTPWEIVGVVDDVRQVRIGVAPLPQFFVNLEQWQADVMPPFPVGPYYAVRASGEPGDVIARVHDVVTRVSAQASLENVATMDQIISNHVTRPRMYAVLLGVFAAIALILASAGIYGVMAYAVTRRTREIGIRMALGARPSEVLAMVLRQSAILTIAGIVIGLAGAAATTRYLESLLFGLTPLDLSTFAAVGVLFASIATLASLVPARRATKVDPLVALRCE